MPGILQNSRQIQNGSISPLLSNLTRAALDLIFPTPCAGCGRDGGIICPSCAGRLTPLTAPYCPICAAPGSGGICAECQNFPRGFDSLRAPYRFEGLIRDAIHRLKYNGEKTAAKPLAALMCQYLQINPADADDALTADAAIANALTADALIPVPLHPRRLRRRGYNQSSLLAREIGRNLNFQMQENLLIRVKNPQPQAQTPSPQQRRSNVSGNFACPADASGLTALLIDDVATTASTLSECAAALKTAGAARVHALVLARDG